MHNNDMKGASDTVDKLCASQKLLRNHATITNDNIATEFLPIDNKKHI